MVRVIVGAALAVVVGCSSSATKPPARCADVAACTTACEPCRDGTCSEHDGRACYDLGRLHLRGQPPQFDLAAAASAYDAGCHAFAPACAALALQVQDGRGVPYDADKARALYTRACDDGAGVGCFNVGVMYEGGVGVPRDPAKARERFARAEALYIAECRADPTWCSNLGYLYENGMVGSGPDPKRAAEVYTRACDRGDHGSCVSLASLELDGKGVPANRDAAIARLRRSCDAGEGLACVAVATTTDKDLADPEHTFALMERACDAGTAEACGGLGAYYVMGRGGPPKPERGYALTERACDLGDSLSCMIRGEDWKDVDPARAAPFYERACHIARPDACLAYATLIASGKLAGDARPWVEAACRQGSADACRLLQPPP